MIEKGYCATKEHFVMGVGRRLNILTTLAVFIDEFRTNILKFKNSFKTISGIILCSNCKKQGEKLKCCSQCNMTYYCDAECQKQHWPIHKITCKKRKQQ